MSVSQEQRNNLVQISHRENGLPAEGVVVVPTTDGVINPSKLIWFPMDPEEEVEELVTGNVPCDRS